LSKEAKYKQVVSQVLQKSKESDKKMKEASALIKAKNSFNKTINANNHTKMQQHSAN
jgi:hypothetical protein